MPHPDNSDWMSMLAGRPITPPVRKTPEDVIATRGFLDRSHLNVDLPELEVLHEGVVLRERQGVRLTAEIYVPKGQGPFPTLLYLHGGAWVAGSAKGSRKVATRIAAADHTVVSVDYGLAPEHPFPWAVEDCVYAARWAVRNAATYGGDAGRLGIAGESAGANLAAAAIVYLAGGSGFEVDEGDLDGIPVEFSAALLIYGIFDFPLVIAEPGSNVGAAEIVFNLSYLGHEFLRHHRNPLVSPVYAPNLDRFPPTYLTCGDEDSLLNQSLAMTKALAGANVATTLSVVAGCDHAFIYLGHLLQNAEPELERMIAWLRAHTGARAAEEVAADAR